MGKKVKTGLFIFLFAAVWLPFLQELFPFIREVKLNGAFVPAEKPELSIDSLRAGTFQPEFEKYQNERFGFRNFLVKVKNSTDYLLFHQLNVEDNIEGSGGLIYSKSSVERSLDMYYKGPEKNAATIERIRFMKDGIEKLGHHLLVLLAPSKEMLYPGNLPAPYAGRPLPFSDYHDFVNGFEKDSIPFIDLYPIIKQLKDTSQYPVFTKTGFHWSAYTAGYAQDYLVRRIRGLIPEPMPEYRRTGLEISDTARESDADFEGPQNLLFGLGQKKYVYSTFRVVPETMQRKRPKVIVIGDSFFWQIKDRKMLMHLFSDDSQFWFYFATTSFPLIDKASFPLGSLDIMAELESADIVVISGSMGTLGMFPYGIADYYYDHVKPAVSDALIEYIKTRPAWMDRLNATATGSQKTINEVLTNTAKCICRDAGHFNLQAANGKFVCADAARGDIVNADKERPSSWELFSCLQLDKNNIVLVSFRDKFVSAGLQSSMEITANSTAIGKGERMEKIDLGNGFVAFRAGNGRYLSLDDKTLQLFASATAIGKNEQFRLIRR